MRALSLFTANTCENAKNDKCTCRCHGALHGARRLQTNKFGDTPREEFEALSEDDPHFVPSKERAKELAKERKAEKQRQLRKARAEAWRRAAEGYTPLADGQYVLGLEVA